MCLLCWIFEATSLLVKPFLHGHLQLAKYYGLFSELCYGPIREWASILAQVLLVIQYSIDYEPICRWESAFATLLWVIKYMYTVRLH